VHFIFESLPVVYAGAATTGWQPSGLPENDAAAETGCNHAGALQLDFEFSHKTPSPSAIFRR